MEASWFRLTIRTGGAAFYDDGEQELARVLRVIADQVQRGEQDIVVRDHNGNSLGRVEWE